ncbi:MAG: hypothetical protein LCH79_15355 [Proteobacteria bacterium]|nr:hypothetical protein [Pseudomonadota bacterium]
MTHCTNCGRRMKAASPTGLGPVCARKAKAVPVPDQDAGLFGYDIERAVLAAQQRIRVHIAVMAEDAHQAVRRGFRAARERLLS